jgi:hypothetical protein
MIAFCKSSTEWNAPRRIPARDGGEKALDGIEPAGRCVGMKWNVRLDFRLGGSIYRPTMFSTFSMN